METRSAVCEENLPTEIHIDTSAIPTFRRRELAEGALKLMEQVFSRPGEEERFQAWLRERQSMAVR